MDPLSIIASIVGIATTGAALSKTIYEFISSTRGASREMRQIARAIADLSIILGELHRVLRESAELYNRKFLRRIKSATKRISRIHGEIHKLMDGARGLTAFTWMLKRSEVHHKLVQIESHKTGVNLMLNILVLAVATRKQAKPSRPQVQRGDQQNDGQDQKNDISLLRQQAENLAFAAHQSLVDLSESQAECITDSEQPNGTDSDDKSETTSQLQVQVYKKKSDDTNDWIFDLVFLSYAQSCADPSNQESAGLSSNSTVPEIDEDAQGLSSKNERSTGKMAMIRDPSEIQIALYNPGAASSLVRELLADWTVLTEKEIESVTDDSQGSKQKEEKTSNESQEVKEIVYFTDAVGRKFTFPFHRVKEYEGMKQLIDAAFLKVDVLGPHVLEGHFDLIDTHPLRSPDGASGEDAYIILPEIWEDFVHPGMTVGMIIWPIDKQPPTSRQSVPVPRPLGLNHVPPNGGRRGVYPDARRGRDK